MEFKMINLGVYYEHLKKQIEFFIIEKQKERDPYKQWILAEKITLVNSLIEDYNRLMMNQ